MRFPSFHPANGELQRFADGESEGSERERVTRHLASCTECRALVSFIRDVAAKARNLDAPRAPAEPRAAALAAPLRTVRRFGRIRRC